MQTNNAHFHGFKTRCEITISTLCKQEFWTYENSYPALCLMDSLYLILNKYGCMATICHIERVYCTYTPNLTLHIHVHVDWIIVYQFEFYISVFECIKIPFYQRTTRFSVAVVHWKIGSVGQNLLMIFNLVYQIYPEPLLDMVFNVSVTALIILLN